MTENNKKTAIIIGAGPAGLSAACRLLDETDIKPIIIEQSNIIGGISKTVFYDNNGTDIGPHRFFTKSKEVMDFITSFLPLQGKPAKDDILLNREFEETVGSDPEKEDLVLLKRKRFSRIYYLKKFFDYPISLKPKLFFNLGLIRTMKIGFSYIKSCVVKRKEVSLEDFMINHFGKVLYELFFEKYTQKVWGKHPSEIPKDWGSQRIKGVSLFKILLKAMLTPFNKVLKRETERSLVEEYFYPKYGAGQLWDLMAEKITKSGGQIRFNSKITRFYNDDKHIYSVVLENGEEIKADYIISSMPIKDLINGMQYVPEDVQNIASNLEYRNYILVSLLASKINLENDTNYPTINNIAPDSWIYMQEEDIKAGRLHIMNNFTPYVIEDYKNKILINLEYFCSEGDEFWTKSQKDMIDFGISELEKLNIIKKEDVLNSKYISVDKAYPAYFGAYKDFDTVKNYLNKFDNIYCIGRNGQHKYNNMDHSILSGLKVAEALKSGDVNLLWDVNTENDYQETK